MSAQIIFNRQIDFNLPFSVLTSVLPTDSCYYTVGVITDTTETYTIGNIFAKFSLEGELEFVKKLSHPDKFYETWQGDIIEEPGRNLTTIGYVIDTIQRGLIITYNTTGDTIHTKEFFSIYYPEHPFVLPREIKRLDNGDYIVLIGHDSGNNADFSLLFLDSTFQEKQYLAYGDQNTEIPMSLVVDDDGGYIIGGSKSNFGLVLQDYESQTYVVKVDSLGELVWEYFSPPNQLQAIAYAMTKTSDSGLVISSAIGKEHIINPTVNGVRWDGYIFKIDANQTFEWGTPIRGSRSTVVSTIRKIVSASDNSGYIGAGIIVENPSDTLPLFSTHLVKVSLQGDSLWNRYFNIINGIESNPTIYDLEATPDGGYVIVGETRPSLGDTTLQRAWILKTDEHGCLVPGCHIIDTVKEPNQSAIQVKLYPNPASEILNIFIRTNQPNSKYDFRITDNSGRIFQTFQNRFSEETLTISLTDYPNGIYYLQVLNKEEIIKTKQFVISK